MSRCARGVLVELAGLGELGCQLRCPLSAAAAAYGREIADEDVEEAEDAEDMRALELGPGGRRRTLVGETSTVSLLAPDGWRTCVVAITQAWVLRPVRGRGIRRATTVSRRSRRRWATCMLRHRTDARVIAELDVMIEPPSSGCIRRSQRCLRVVLRVALRRRLRQAGALRTDRLPGLDRRGRCLPPGRAEALAQCCRGGECASTAVALLFAMLRFWPVPSGRRCRSMRRWTRRLPLRRRAASLADQELEFIVDDPHRGTIESADVLYGD